MCWALVQPSLLYTGLILAALGFLGRRLAAQVAWANGGNRYIRAGRGVVPALILRWYMPLHVYAETDSSRRFAATILSSPERDSPIYGYYYFRNSLPFYLRRPVGLLSAGWERDDQQLPGGASGKGSGRGQ